MLVCLSKQWHYLVAFQDPFGDVIKKIMNAIHDHAQLNPTCDLGSQNYEQWVIQTERIGEHNSSGYSSADSTVTSGPLGESKRIWLGELLKGVLIHYSGNRGRSESAGMCGTSATVQRGLESQQHHSHVWLLQFPEEIPWGGAEEKKHPRWGAGHANHRYRAIPLQFVSRCWRVVFPTILKLLFNVFDFIVISTRTCFRTLIVAF